MEPSSETTTLLIVQENIRAEFFNLGQIAALVNKTYKFARGEEGLDVSPLTMDNFIEAYTNVGLSHPDTYKGLIEFTEGKLKKEALVSATFQVLPESGTKSAD